MNIIIIILIVIACIVALVLVVASFSRKIYNVQANIVINAPREKVFDYIKYLKNQDYYNKWVMADPNMKKIFTGTDGTRGFIYAWDGNKKAGSGEQEITTINEGKNMESEVRFVRPYEGIANMNMITTSISSGETKVDWSSTGKIKYPMNIMISSIEKMLVKDMDTSLALLKNILEK